jgi:hypothetical protein
LHDCLKLISGSKNLRFFAASNWTAPATDLELLANCPNIQRLLISQLTGSQKQLFILARLGHLCQLEMPALAYRPGLAADLKSLKSLKTLKFFVTDNWTEEQLSQLRRDLPDVNVVVYKSPTDVRDAFWLP